jgi:hypothetical protein
MIARVAASKWDRGDYVKAPLSLPLERHPSRVATIQLLVNSSSGWVVNMPLYPEDLPADYAALGKSLALAKRARSVQIAQYLDSKQ